MSFNLPAAARACFNSDFIAKAAAVLGENGSGIAAALNHMVPALIGELVAKTSSSEGAEATVSAARKTYGTDILNNPGAFLDNAALQDNGARLVNMFLGDRMGNGLTKGAAAASGIKNESAVTLLSIVTPVVLGVIGKEAETNNLGASGISALLSNSKKIINMSTETGGGGHNIENTSGAAHDTHHGDDNISGGVRWVVPLVLLAALAFLAWWLLQNRGCSKPAAGHDEHGQATGGHDDTLSAKKSAGDMNMPKLTIDSTGMVSYELGKDVEFTLPDGTKFMAAENGFEAQLLRFIKDGKIDTVNKSANWLNMFNVQFKSGGNEYIGKAADQVKNCGAILKAYPNVKIKLGGYTDNTGAADVNKRVSQQRADKVKTDLLKMGATAAQIVESVGYGPEFPVCAANDTPECRARNRRVACKVDTK